MSGKQIPADDWHEEKAARAAYGDYVRKLKRQVDAKNVPRIEGAEKRFADSPPAHCRRVDRRGHREAHRA
jgi:hypothetical protein